MAQIALILILSYYAHSLSCSKLTYNASSLLDPYFKENVMRFWLRCILGACALAPTPTWALELSFEEAQQLLYKVSDAIAGSQSQLESRQHLAKASDSLSYPEVTLDVKQMRFSKHLDLAAIEPLAQANNLFIPSEVDIVEWRTRPIITATLPIWTGGKISAGKAAARAGVSEARALLASAQQKELSQLIEAYFGQHMANQVLLIRTDVRAGLQQHYQRASRLEAEGFATQAQKLQAKVALDEAERELRKAQNDLQGAQAALSGLLHTQEVVKPSSPLFVWQRSLPAVEQFIDSALAQHPGLLQIQAIKTQAEQKLEVEKAGWLPTVYAFGQYDLKPEDALVSDSNWAFGVGLSYKLLSNQNRSRQVRAAHSQINQASYSLQDNQVKLTIAVKRSWLAADSARQQFTLLESALDSAKENLRLQELSFQAGQATSLDVIDASLKVGKVRIERAQAAWQFDLALMQLLDVSGQSDQFNHYLQLADKVLANKFLGNHDLENQPLGKTSISKEAL